MALPTIVGGAAEVSEEERGFLGRLFVSYGHVFLCMKISGKKNDIGWCVIIYGILGL